VGRGFGAARALFRDRDRGDAVVVDLASLRSTSRLMRVISRLTPASTEAR
jgi:hypothetical protein